MGTGSTGSPARSRPPDSRGAVPLHGRISAESLISRRVARVPRAHVRRPARDATRSPGPESEAPAGIAHRALGGTRWLTWSLSSQRISADRAQKVMLEDAGWSLISQYRSPAPVAIGNLRETFSWPRMTDSIRSATKRARRWAIPTDGHRSGYQRHVKRLREPSPGVLTADRPSAFQAGPIPVAVNRASVLRWRRSPLLAVGRCCCYHRCCQLTLSGGQRVTKVPRRHGGYWVTLDYAQALQPRGDLP